MESNVESVSGLVPVVKRLSRGIAPTVRFETDREDMMQEGMVGLLEAAKRYQADRGCSLRTFSTKRARGAMLDHVRSLVRRNREAPAHATMDSKVDCQWAQTPRSLESKVDIIRFRRFLREHWFVLPRLEREVIRLRYFLGLSVRDAAADLGTSPATVVRAEQRGLDMLRDGMKKKNAQNQDAAAVTLEDVKAIAGCLQSR